MKITVYVVDDGRIVRPDVASPGEIPARAIWIDVVESTTEETITLAKELGLQIEFDAANLGFDVYDHVEVEAGQLTIVMRTERGGSAGDPRNERNVILMTKDKLVTLRGGSAPAIEAAARSAQNLEAGPRPQMQIVIQILEIAMKIMSRGLDAAEAEVDRNARTLFSTAETRRVEVDLKNLLSGLGRLQARMVAMRSRHSLLSRVVQILRSEPRFELTADLQNDLDLAAAEVVSLSDFAASVDEQLSRLMDSTIGFIGLRQNASARWFSFVATVFMPPTLLAAIWGMNFQYMPELDDRYAYAIALGLILLSGTIPLWVARRLGWLGR